MAPGGYGGLRLSDLSGCRVGGEKSGYLLFVPCGVAERCAMVGGEWTPARGHETTYLPSASACRRLALCSHHGSAYDEATKSDVAGLRTVAAVADRVGRNRADRTGRTDKKGKKRKSRFGERQFRCTGHEVAYQEK